LTGVHVMANIMRILPSLSLQKMEHVYGPSDHQASDWCALNTSLHTSV